MFQLPVLVILVLFVLAILAVVIGETKPAFTSGMKFCAHVGGFLMFLVGIAVFIAWLIKAVGS